MAKVLRLAFVSSATFNRIQTFHAVPVVKELWGKMKDGIWQAIKDENLVLCGDQMHKWIHQGSQPSIVLIY